MKLKIVLICLISLFFSSQNSFSFEIIGGTSGSGSGDIKALIEGYSTLDLSGIGPLSLPTNVLLSSDIGDTIQAKLTIIYGSKVLSTESLAGNTCRIEIDNSQSGVAVGDRVTGQFSALPVAGYGALATETLSLKVSTEVAGEVKFEVCNNGTDAVNGAGTVLWQIIK